jgi:hypothetical protein
LPQQLVEPLAIDELHGVVGGAADLADVEDRHDVGVVQTRRRPRLTQEPLQRSCPARRADRQHLQGHPFVQRQVYRLVDHPHPAAGDLPLQAIAAERLAGGQPRAGQALDQQQRREQLADALGQFRVAPGIVLDVRQMALTGARRELFR